MQCGIINMKYAKFGDCFHNHLLDISIKFVAHPHLGKGGSYT